jgi:hypothetical protein
MLSLIGKIVDHSFFGAFPNPIEESKCSIWAESIVFEEG